MSTNMVTVGKIAVPDGQLLEPLRIKVQEVLSTRMDQRILEQVIWENEVGFNIPPNGAVYFLSSYFSQKTVLEASRYLFPTLSYLQTPQGAYLFIPRIGIM